MSVKFSYDPELPPQGHYCPHGERDCIWGCYPLRDPVQCDGCGWGHAAYWEVDGKCLCDECGEAVTAVVTKECNGCGEEFDGYHQDERCFECAAARKEAAE